MAARSEVKRVVVQKEGMVESTGVGVLVVVVLQVMVVTAMAARSEVERVVVQKEGIVESTGVGVLVVVVLHVVAVVVTVMAA